MATLSNQKPRETQSYECLSTSNSSKPSKVMYCQRGPARTLMRSTFMPPRQMKSAPEINVQAKNHAGKDAQKTIESCRRLKVQSYQNQLVEAQRTIDNLMTENRTLRTMHQRQEVALHKYEAANTDLPKLLNSHSEEVRMWEVKCRNLLNANREMQERLPKKESLIHVLSDQNEYFKELNESKHLEERQRLAQHLKELEKQLDLKTKNVGQAIWRWQAELRHVKQQLTLAQKKVRSCVYNLEKSRIQASGIDKLQKMNLFEPVKDENITNKLAIIKENPILTEPSTAEETDTPQIYETSSSRKLSSMQRRLNQQQLTRRRVERGDGDANVITSNSLVQQIPRTNSDISQSIIENSSINQSSCSEYEDNPSALTEDEETPRLDAGKDNDNRNQLKSMTELTVSDSQLSCVAPTTTTDFSGTEDDCQSLEIQKNTTLLKKEISDLRSRIDEDFNIRMNNYSRTTPMQTFISTDESDADSQVMTNNITEIIEKKIIETSIVPNAAPSMRANQLLATLKKSYDENNEKKD